ncbi:MAG: DNA mismatch repair protein MutS [Planctomycetota bacterium]
MRDPRDTPAMRQYARFKEEHPDCVLLFRMGDFYELFFEDAELIAGQLGLTLTQRTGGVPLAGVPHHQLDTYLRKLVALGHRVAIADQVQDPKEAKGVVERAVTQVVTPGTLVDDGLLEGAASDRLAAVCFTGSGEDAAAVGAVADASTGAFEVFEAADGDALADELASRAAREVLYAETATGEAPERVARVLRATGAAGTGRPAWQFRQDEAMEVLRSQFGVATLAGFGLADDAPVISAAGAVVRYLRETKAVDDEAAHSRPGAFAASTLAHLRPPKLERDSARCAVDAVSLRALEVERTIRGGTTEGALLGLFVTAPGRGGCRTAMGKRLVRDWLCRPSGSRSEIEPRHACVAALAEDRRLARELGEALAPVQDIARIAGRVALGRCSPRDVVGLGTSIARLGILIELLAGTASFAETVGVLRGIDGDLTRLAERIAAVCVDEPPAHLRDGGVIRDGVDAALDEARGLRRDASAWLASYQAEVAEALGLPGIKVGFNKVFGYYVELSAAQARDAADALERGELIRKQTLKNAERFITPKLKTFEDKVLRAEGDALERERVLFAELVSCIAAELEALTVFAEAAARTDALLAFADRAAAHRWVRPAMRDEPTLSIRDGRHPVLESTLAGEFVPNGVDLAGEGHPGLALITGPNMAGKSTFIRQVALIALLAHAGSFVPAESATIGVTDRIFTRVGADDALHEGRSTFMVEMIETANILNHATPGSLVILDEIGRGTSTLDGLSLAWAIVEALAGSAETPGPRTLFATHYHELTELDERLPGRVANLHVTVREWTPKGTDGPGETEIVFLHRVAPGRADQSYGVQVARLAGVPKAVTDRAKQVLESLAVQHGPSATPLATAPRPSPQLSLFTELLPHPAVDRLAEVKLEELTPMEAFDVLRELRGMLDEADGD